MTEGEPVLLPVHVGCSGWSYQHWRGRLYPEGLPSTRWLGVYAQHFRTVEVNATFYRLPSSEAVRRWLEQTDEGFLFAVKASRYLTHVKRLHGVAEGLARFWERIEPLSAAMRLGAVLWQLPDGFVRDEERLASLLEALPAGRHAFEFRDRSWFAQDVYRLLREHGAALVTADHLAGTPSPIEATAPWRYLRFHYGHCGRRGNYSHRELDRWAQLICRWRRSEEIFAYFNNDWEAFAPRNASYIAALLS